MNQILYVDSKKKKQPTDIKKVILFFGIAIIIVGLIFAGQGVYVMISNKQNNTQNPSVQDTVPQVAVEKEDNEDNIVITVNHDKAISKIIYQWNDKEEQEIAGDNRTNITETIPLPFGTNTLTLKVIDINGKQTEYQKEYIVDGDGKPVIDLALTNDNKIKITAHDTQSLKYIIYTWNNGEETKIEASAENAQQIEKEVEIPLGQNTLKVQAINQNDVTTIKELEVKGVKTPKVELRKEGEYLIIRVEDETGIERIDYTLNGKSYRMDVASKNYTSLEYKQKLEAGENKIILKAYNKDGGEKEVKGKTVL